MSENKKTVEKYMNGFHAADHEMILSCLTDDVSWYMPGFFNHQGKEAFDKEIENENFVGRPVIKICRYVEADDVVIAEGSVQANMKGGGILDAVFCDVFDMQNGKIKKLITYLMSKTGNAGS